MLMGGGCTISYSTVGHVTPCKAAATCSLSCNSCKTPARGPQQKLVGHARSCLCNNDADNPGDELPVTLSTCTAKIYELLRFVNVERPSILLGLRRQL